MEKLILEVPAEVVDAARLPPGEIEREFLKELALALYQRGVLSLGKARLLAQMTRWEFEELLGQQGVLRHYTQADLEEDMKYAHYGE
jgi:Uncharacterised protein family (UPF0175).